MKIAYFDCTAGISGNMVIGALLNAGVPIEYLKGEIVKILPHDKYKLIMERIAKPDANAIYFDVGLPRHEGPIDHEKAPTRNLFDIERMFRSAGLEDHLKERLIKIFTRLAEAEAKAHDCPIGKIGFHEDGAVDTIIDIFGAVMGLRYLGVEKVYASPLHVGSGTIKYRYGVLPVPAPATAELLKGIPCFSTEVKGELVTPTGAAIITTLAEEYGLLKNMNVETIGYGAATMHSGITGLLRVYVGYSRNAFENTGTLVNSLLSGVLL